MEEEDARQAEPDGTLAGASGHALGKFLQKRGRRGQRDLPKAAAEAASVLPRAAQPLLPEGICGAPAGTAADDEQPRASSSCTEALPAAAQPALAGEESDEWEAAGDAPGLEGFLEQAQAEAGGDDSGLVISLGSGAEGGGAPGSKPKGRRTYTKMEVLAAALVHQAHLLCLLGRARMQDAAANDAAVQAAAISLVPLRELRPIEARSSSDGLLASQLTDLLQWFQRAFSVEPLPLSDEPEQAIGGMAAAIRRLEAAAASKKGAAEDLVALFVAVLRSSGLLVRYVRVLDPLPWRPGANERHVPKQAAGGKRAAQASGPKAGGRGRGRKRKGAAAEGEAAEEAEEGATPAKAAKGRKGKAKKAKAEPTDVEPAKLEPEEAAAPPGTKRQRSGKADLEFENQLAMAMLASAGAGAGSTAAAAEQAAAQAAKTAGKANSKAAPPPGLGSTWARAQDRSQVADCWAEVFCDGEASGQGRWVALHPLLGWLDEPERVEGASVRCGPLAYVVALHGGGAKDVTSRYAANVRTVEKARGPNARWWTRTLQPLRRAETGATRDHLARLGGGAGPGPSASRQGGAGPQPTAQKQAKARAAREDAELRARVEAQQLETPTTLEGFKNHKHYVLQRHISRYTAIRPGAQQVGLHRGEPFFRTADVSELHTAGKWQQLGWQVTDAQLGQPFKEVPCRGAKKKAAAAAAATADAGDAEELGEDGAAPAQKDPALVTKLYGKWQTQPWQPPAARDGVVPKNERGTVHCPPLAAALPLGTRQIDRPRITGVCKRLGVDYAMAMTGFDIRAGRSKPRFQGVVVCEECAEAVLAEWHREQSEAAEKEARKRMEAAGTRWAALLRAIFTRLQLTDAPEAEAGQPAPVPKRGGRKAGGKGSRGRGKAAAAAKAAAAGGEPPAPEAEALEEGWRQSEGGAAAEFEEI